MTKKTVFAAVCSALCLFAFAACELFNNPKDPDFLNNLYDEIAYANATRLTKVTLDVAPAAGSSTPTAGLITDTRFRQGFKYPLNYFPSTEFYFVEWQAGNYDENNEWISLLDASKVKFENPKAEVTNVIINTTEPITIRPFAEVRPFIEAHNLSWEDDEYTDRVIKIKFSRSMDKDSFRWGETVRITCTGGKEYKGETFGDEFNFSNYDTVLELMPKGSFMNPRSRIDITFIRGSNNNGIQALSEDGTRVPLAKNTTISYNTASGRAPKPRFHGTSTVRFATRNGSTWNIWNGDPATYGADTSTRVPADKQVYLVFLPEEDSDIRAIRVTETTIRQIDPDYKDDSPGLTFGSEIININSIDINPSGLSDPIQMKNGFPAGSKPIAVPYTLKSDNNSWITESRYYGGISLRVELYNGIVYSDDSADSTEEEKPKTIQTKFSPSLEQISAMKQITGAATIAGASFDGYDEGFEEGSIIIRYKYYVNIDARPVFSLLRTPHSLPFFTPVSGLLREVTIPNYRLGETQVTQKHWETIRLWALANGYTNISVGTNRTNGDNFPVTGITWRDMIVWCNAYSEANNLTPVYVNNSGIVFKNGTSDDIDYTTLGNFWQNDNFRNNWHTRNGFRLPFEMEWDYAARGGNSTTTEMGVPWNFGYSGSNIWQEVANFSGTIQTVRQRAANTLGLFDMSGNVDEWVWDSGAGGYGDDTIITGPYHISSVVNNRIFRGGNFSSTGNAQLLTHHGRDFARGEAAPTTSAATRGFRVARNGW